MPPRTDDSWVSLSPFPFPWQILGVLLTAEANSSNLELLSVLQSPPSRLLSLLMLTAPPPRHVPQALSTAVTPHSPPSVSLCETLVIICAASLNVPPLVLPQTQTSASTSVALLTLHCLSICGVGRIYPNLHFPPLSTFLHTVSWCWVRGETGSKEKEN